jgi:predicted hydrocarbon binding protein
MAETETRATMLGFPVDTLRILRRVLEEDGSPAEAAGRLRRLGYESGEAFHDALRGRVDAESRPLAELGLEEFWRRLADFFGELGWGRLEFQQLHAGVAALESRDWAEAEGRHSAAPSCHYTTGVLADVLGRVAGDVLAVLEVECRAAGADRCRFLLGGREALERVYESVRGGAADVEALHRLG